MDRAKRVLQVYRDYFTSLPGGIERHVRDLAHGLRPDFDVEVLSSSRSRRSRVHQDADVNVHLSAEWVRVQGLAVCPGWRRVMTRGDYDLVHLHAPNPTGEIAFLAQRSNAVGVMTYHADLHRAARAFPAYRRLLERVIARCARVIASSEEFVRSSPVLSELARRRPEALAVVPFGVDLDRFRPESNERVDAIRERWGDGPTVLFVGRLRYYKGLPVLIEAMRNVDARLVIAGGGPEQEAVLSAASDALGERFVYEGEVADEVLPDLYRSADIFCLPSTSAAETFGIAGAEALASGLPVVTTEVGTATSTLTLEGSAGLTIPPNDPAALSEALKTLATDETRRTAMAASARAGALDRFDQRAMFERVGQIYREASST